MDSKLFLLPFCTDSTNEKEKKAMDFVIQDEDMHDHMDIHLIGVRVCVRNDDYWTQFLGLFLMSPLGALLVGNCISFLYGIDVAYFIAYNVGGSFNWAIAWLISNYLKVNRPEFARQCGYKTYGSPDDIYVFTCSMLFILAFVGIMRITRIRYFSAFMFLFIIGMYTYASWHLEYLTTTQILENLNLAMILGLLWTVVYVKVLAPYDSYLAKLRVLRWMGFNDLLAVPRQRHLQNLFQEA